MDRPPVLLDPQRRAMRYWVRHNEALTRELPPLLRAMEAALLAYWEKKAKHATH